MAAAISAAAVKEAGPLPPAEGFTAMPGLGARATVSGREVIIGRAGLLASLEMLIPNELSAQCRLWERAGFTAVLAGWDGAVRGALAVGDAIKPSARTAIAELRALGLHPSC